MQLLPLIAIAIAAYGVWLHGIDEQERGGWWIIRVMIILACLGVIVFNGCIVVERVTFFALLHKSV